MATDLPISQKESRIERFESSNEETTEDYFLQIPHEVLDMIFIRLSFQNLARCMRVCKRFKSMLTEQSFSKNYLKTNYSFVPVELDAGRLETFEYTSLDQSLPISFCCWDGTFKNSASNEPSRYLFRPFPQVWDNGIVTPGGFDVFAQGANYNYHSLNKAVHLLLSLLRKCREFRITNTAPYNRNMVSALRVCLFPWQGDKLPTPEEVLKIFYVHEEIISSDRSGLVGHADVLTIPPPEQDELEYDEIITSLRNTFSSIEENEEHQDDLFLWLQKFFQPSLMFCSGPHTIYPQPYFHLTVLSPGWVGGVFTIIGIGLI